MFYYSSLRKVVLVLPALSVFRSVTYEAFKRVVLLILVLLVCPITEVFAITPFPTISDYHYIDLPLWDDFDIDPIWENIQSTMIDSDDKAREAYCMIAEVNRLHILQEDYHQCAQAFAMTTLIFREMGSSNQKANPTGPWMQRYTEMLVKMAQDETNVALIQADMNARRSSTFLRYDQNRV